MHFVYQTHDIVRGRRKRGKMLDEPVIHIMDGEKAVCGIAPQAKLRARCGKITVVESGARLMRLTDEQIQAWLFSQTSSKSFSAVMCYTCLYWIQTRIKQRGSEGIPEIIQEVACDMAF